VESEQLSAMEAHLCEVYSICSFNGSNIFHIRWSYVRLYIRSHGHKILYAIIPAICSERYSSLVTDVRNRYYFYQFRQIKMINKTKN
jgi:hypothetical protein